METQDGLGFIGRNPMDADNVYVATGDSGMGLTHGTIAGMLICDLIQGHANRWAPLYDPGRIRVGAGGGFREGEPQRRRAVRGLGDARRGVVGRRDHPQRRAQ